MSLEPQPVRATTLIHQEGVLGVIALAVLAFREGGPAAALAPTPGRLLEGVLVAAVVAAAIVLGLWWCRRLPPVRRLQSFQARLVRSWSASDAAAVALLSGLAEEALMRAVLQPLIGLLPAATLFALLHLVPDRELWFWPVFALALGLVFGLLFERYGYPAAASGHMVLNLLAIQQLRGSPEEAEESS